VQEEKSPGMEDSRRTILIVDDVPENLEILSAFLRDIYTVKVATRGQRALDIVRRSPPDLILLDIMMPEMDGFEVCRRLKSDYTTRHIPVIFATAKIEPEAELEGLALGAVDYISKPFNPPVVLARVRTHLALYDQNRELESRVEQRTVQLHDTRLQIIRRLGRAAEYKDNETGLHVIRMSHYARLIGLAAGMSEQRAEVLLNAAPMHDIGKIGIPDSILQKPGKLTPDEWEVMKTHAAIGAEIIGDPQDSELLEMAKVVAVSHHEKWDGSGYPHSLAGEDIPRVGRIVAIADVFDALTSERPYKKAWPVEEAVSWILSQSGQHFDPQLTECFARCLPDIEAIRQQYREDGASPAPQPQ
jgi:putative two-component system response regulator